MSTAAYRARALLAGLAASLVLAACNPTPDTASAPAPVESPAATPEVPQTRHIRVEPASLTGCSPVVATVHWDTSGLTPLPPTVKVHIAGRAGERLFAAGGAKGQAETGRWALPGSTFVLRHGTTGEELERVAVQGPDCSG